MHNESKLYLTEPSKPNLSLDGMAKGNIDKHEKLVKNSLLD